MEGLPMTMTTTKAQLISGEPPESRVFHLESYDDEGTRFCVKLWNVSGQLIWEKEEPNSSKPYALPTFSEDGKYLVVHFGDYATILDSHASAVISVSLIGWAFTDYHIVNSFGGVVKGIFQKFFV